MIKTLPPRFQAEQPVRTVQPKPLDKSEDTIFIQNMAAAKKSLWSGLKAATPRLADALGLFVWSNVLFGPGHVFMLPIALVDGAIAVNEFRKASGLKPLVQNQAAGVFLKTAKTAIDKAKLDATAWEKPFRWMYKLGLATTAAGVLIHPLLFVGLALLAFPNLARDLGITVNVFKQLLLQGKGARSTN